MVYKIEALDLNALLMPVTSATAAVARLDERLARSPVREGWIERQHFNDACAALWLEGELVHVEDLVLHDAHMDIRMPTHELTRAHGVLRARRQIFGQKPDWALSGQGLRQLTRRGAVAGDAARANGAQAQDDDTSAALANDDAGEEHSFAQGLVAAAPDDLTKALKAMDAALERSAKVLDGQSTLARLDRSQVSERPVLVYDLDWDEDARLSAWQEVVSTTRALPVVLRAAVLIEAWSEIDVLQHAGWLGTLLTAALLRQEGIAAHHLIALHVGTKQIPREKRRARDRTDRLLATLDAMHQAANLGLKEHDRLILAKAQMDRRLSDRRSNSRLPELIALVLSRPLVSSSMIQERLKVSKQGALNLVSELTLREMTGRGRFRAWGVM
jgi:Protein of unknown function (DUF1612)/HTH DNA binding domain